MADNNVPDFRAIAERMAQGTVVWNTGGSDDLPRAIERFEAELRAMYERGRLHLPGIMLLDRVWVDVERDTASLQVDPLPNGAFRFTIRAEPEGNPLAHVTINDAGVLQIRRVLDVPGGGASRPWDGRDFGGR